MVEGFGATDWPCPIPSAPLPPLGFAIPIPDQPQLPHRLFQPRPHLLDVGPLRQDVAGPTVAVAPVGFEHRKRGLGIDQPRRLGIGPGLQRALRFPNQLRLDLDIAIRQRLVEIGAELRILAPPLVNRRPGHARRPARALAIGGRREMIEELAPPSGGETPAFRLFLGRPPSRALLNAPAPAAADLRLALVHAYIRPPQSGVCTLCAR